ncbi:E3 ubiquitin-protein like [Actinidia chinensis var. chinensis]|uniref:E3 ubiquitin-protein like n=1 Tax=Actinidia chinensis var. chinensis TaxID=1590841 RepID=A0A2R6P6A9_ACTCC|nr:E3 ubiquitin-protein like [Actinidia chinensis var. chinensis]
MEQEPDHNPPFSSSEAIEGSPSSSQIQEEPEESNQLQQSEDHQPHRSHHHHHHHHYHHRPPGRSYRLNILISDVASTQIRDDAWSCLIVLVIFWFFASVTVIIGFYGSVTLPLGPNCSRLIQINAFFVQSIKAQEIDESKQGPILYGFYETPPLDVEVAWSEAHSTFVQSNYHKEWQYFLNKGSKVDISYSVKSLSSSPLSLVIAQGKESLVSWIEDPSYPNTTLSWNIIHGSGIIHQEISKSNMYYIAVGNLNSDEEEVQLNFTIKGLLYNTTQAYYKCSVSHRLCSLKLFLLKANAAVLTSPGIEQGVLDDDWLVKLSYGPRWITYFVGSGIMTAIILLALRICNMFQVIRGDETSIQTGDMTSERAPLLSPKDDDLLSWGSSYDSISHDEEELDEGLAVASLDGKPPNEGEANSSHRLCVICFDGPRDCFFLPCGHCAACFTCGTRIVEDAGTCPICGRIMKKVRKIFKV